VRVTEVSEGGSVPELKVTNSLDVMLLLIDGQELIGAKQNRILNTDVLVAAKGTLRIPVSCVEQGRWRHVSPQFSPGRAASFRTRSGKSPRVHDSLKAGRRHDADQAAVWDEVGASLSAAAAVSPTMALSDAYAQQRAELISFRGSLQLPAEAVGAAVFHGTRLAGLDLFDRHATLAYFWEALVDGYAIDLLQVRVAGPDPSHSADAQLVREALERAAAAIWEQFPSPGVGRDHRLEDSALTGSALVWEDQVVVHMQLFPRSGVLAQSPAEQYRPRIRRRF
jgi:hypothetical protein